MVKDLEHRIDTLIGTNTTLDHSQKTEKVCAIGWCSSFFLSKFQKLFPPNKHFDMQRFGNRPRLVASFPRLVSKASVGLGNGFAHREGRA